MHTRTQKYSQLIVVFLAVFLITSCSGPTSLPDTALFTIDPGIDSTAWAAIPAGEFLKGQHEHETVIENPYEMMVTPVTNQQYANFLNQALADGSVKLLDDRIVGYYPGDEFRGFRHEEEIAAGDYIYIPLDDPTLRLNFDGKTFTSKPGYENHPMVMVSWFGARGYCQAYDWRLPSEDEWEKAARGEDNRPYPWGEDITAANANYYVSRDPFEQVIGRLGDTTPVGFYNGEMHEGFQTIDSPSPYGLYDMAGNVWQWTGDVYPNQHYRYMRGGSRANYDFELRIWVRNNATPKYFSPSTGFRCARDQ